MTRPPPPSVEMVPGWACDGPKCTAVVSNAPGLSTKDSLLRAGWLVYGAFGEVVRAYCPHCRRGRGPQ